MSLISETAKAAIDALINNGYKAYLVGGAVRSILMGDAPTDIDITTDALPEEVKKTYSGCRVIETGIQHGTVKVIINNTPVEITTFRIEDVYTDGRHPDSISFSKELAHDLKRRDFTMNSIAYNSHEGFIDLFDGAEDIKKRTIRCVGNPEERFTEDALRILRALRFASVTGFTIKKETSEAMLGCKNMINNISVERIYSETVKMLCGSNINKVLVDYFDIICIFMPELMPMKNFNQHNFHHKYDLLNHTAAVVSNIKPVPHLRLAALLHDIAKPMCMTFDSEGTGHFYKHASKGSQIAAEILSRMHSDNNTIDKVSKLIKWHDSPIQEKEEVIKKKLRTMGEEMLRELIELQRADTLGLADEFQNRLQHFERLEMLIDKIISDGQCFALKDLAINGNDMISIGLKGQQIGQALNLALDAVISNKINNNKADLINYIKESRQ